MIKNVIIQAGGDGQRAGKYAKNKPKCLISVGGKPLLFHICDYFPQAQILVNITENTKNHIALRNFLDLHTDYQKRISLILVPEKGSGDGAFLGDLLGMCSGNALICWSDILFKLPDFDESSNVVFLTDKVKCRWKIDDGILQQEHGSGILGCFYIHDAQANCKYFTNDGTIIETLKNKDFVFKTALIEDCQEFGMEEDLTDYYQHNTATRYYNKIVMYDYVVEKYSLDTKVIEREIHWYNQMKMLGFNNVPRKLKDDPLTLERIKGNNLYEHLVSGGYVNPTCVFSLLEKLHNSTKPVFEMNKDLEDLYITETVSRIKQVTKIHKLFSQIPLKINGVMCNNILTNLPVLEEVIRKIIFKGQNIGVCHGDPILSNILIDDKDNLYLIDPRGHYGNQNTVVGPHLYDYAKLYFSSVMNFDTFNKKFFNLTINEDGFELHTADAGRVAALVREAFTREFTAKFETRHLYKIKFLAALMWLRFGSCILDDYDSIIFALAYGIYSINTLI
jgi:hypothetical protein